MSRSTLERALVYGGAVAMTATLLVILRVPGMLDALACRVAGVASCVVFLAGVILVKSSMEKKHPRRSRL